MDRLSLSGRFEITRAVFKNPETQERVDAPSLRGQGRPGNEEISDLLSDLRGSLRLEEAQAGFSRRTNSGQLGQPVLFETPLYGERTDLFV